MWVGYFSNGWNSIELKQQIQSNGCQSTLKRFVPSHCYRLSLCFYILLLLHYLKVKLVCLRVRSPHMLLRADVASRAQREQSCSAVNPMLCSPQERWRQGRNKARGVKKQNCVGRSFTTQLPGCYEVKTGEVKYCSLSAVCSTLTCKKQNHTVLIMNLCSFAVSFRSGNNLL